jgi:asparagine N-glycosylation enzyme membrane subunit Stt3
MSEQFPGMSPASGATQPFGQTKPSMMMPAVYGGLIMGVLYGVPYLNFINCCCCAGVLAGGFLSVFFYKNELLPNMPPLEASDALKLGALSGVIGGVFGTIIAQGAQVLTGQDVQAELDELLDQMNNPDAEAFVQMFVSFFDSPFFLILSLVFSIFICVMFGLLGGLIGYAILKPKQPMMNVPPPYHPPTQLPS